MFIRPSMLPLAVLGIALLFTTASFAQTPTTGPATARATVNDPVGPVPNVKNVPFSILKDLKFEGNSITLWGNPSEPGSPYAVMQRWMPGNFSNPHMHEQDRMIYVISGNWWVSDSPVKDERTTYPMRAGTYVTHPKGTVHWDGNRAGEKEPAILVIMGIGPSRSNPVDANGNIVPRPAGGRGGRGGE